MNVICASHPTLEAVARCVCCGLHLCQACRTKRGVQNFCRSCHGRTAAGATAPGGAPGHPCYAQAAIIDRPDRTYRPVAAPRTPSLRSPSLAAMLSAVPGLGQAYGGSLLRGLLFFGTAAFLHANSIPPVLAAFLFVFNLWDAFQVTTLRNRKVGAVKVEAKELKKDRVDSSLFTLTGLGVMGWTFQQMGGLQHPDPSLWIPLAGLAAVLVIAQETRR